MAGRSVAGRAVTACAVALLLLAGCGGEDADPAGDATVPADDAGTDVDEPGDDAAASGGDGGCPHVSVEEVTDIAGQEVALQGDPDEQDGGGRECRFVTSDEHSADISVLVYEDAEGWEALAGDNEAVDGLGDEAVRWSDGIIHARKGDQVVSVLVNGSAVDHGTVAEALAHHVVDSL